MNRAQFTSLLAATGALVGNLTTSEVDGKPETTPGSLGQAPMPYILVEGEIRPLCSPRYRIKPMQIAPGDPNSKPPVIKKMSFLSLRPLFLHPSLPKFEERTKDAASLTITFAQRQSNQSQIKPQQWTQVLTLIPANDRRDVQAQSVVGINGLFDNIPVGPFGGVLTIEFKSSAFLHQSFVTYERIASKLRTIVPEAGSSGLGSVSTAFAVPDASIAAATAALNLFDVVFEALAADTKLDTHIAAVPRNVSIELDDGNRLIDDQLTLILPRGESILIFVPGPDPTIREKADDGCEFYGSKLPNHGNRPNESAAGCPTPFELIDNDEFIDLIKNVRDFEIDGEGRLTSSNDYTMRRLRTITYVTMNAMVFEDVQSDVPTNVPPVTLTPTPAPVASPTTKIVPKTVPSGAAQRKTPQMGNKKT